MAEAGLGFVNDYGLVWLLLSRAVVGMKAQDQKYSDSEDEQRGGFRFNSGSHFSSLPVGRLLLRLWNIIYDCNKKVIPAPGLVMISLESMEDTGN